MSKNSTKKSTVSHEQNIPYGLERMKFEFRVLHMIYRLSHLLHTSFMHFLSKDNYINLTSEEWFVFATCANHENCSVNQTELAEILLKDKTTITRYLTSLENKGYIHRIKNNLDKRGVFVSLTPAGKKLNHIKDKLNNDVKNTILLGISPEDLEHIYQIMTIMEANIHDHVIQ